MAQVAETHTAKDGVIRSATVKTSSGVNKRPLVKLAHLFYCKCFPEENRAGDVRASTKTEAEKKFKKPLSSLLISNKSWSKLFTLSIV